MREGAVLSEPDDATAGFLLEAAKRFGTPLYVIDEAKVAAAAEEVERAFSPRFLLHYSLKANDLPAVGRILREKGWGANVVSLGEWAQADAAGYGAGEITLEGIGKSDAELEAVVSWALEGRRLRWLVLESRDEAAALQAAQERARFAAAGVEPLELLLRLNPQVFPETVPTLAVGADASKFGMAEAELVEVAALLEEDPSLRLRGVHVHVGSQLSSPAAWADAGVRAVALAAELRQRHLFVDTVDVGGGFPAPGPSLPGPAAFLAALEEALGRAGLPLPPRAAIEPGRFLVGHAGFLVARVLHVRADRGGSPMVVIDAGMTELIRPALYGALHPVLALHSTGVAVPTAVEGPVCESTDSFGTHLLPPLRRGDVVAVSEAGAYGASFTSRYNGRPAPPEVVLTSKRELRLESRAPLSPHRPPARHGVVGR